MLERNLKVKHTVTEVRVARPGTVKQNCKQPKVVSYHIVRYERATMLTGSRINMNELLTIYLTSLGLRSSI